MSDENDFTLDPDVEDELDEIDAEDPMVVEYGTHGQDGGEKIQFTEKWFPGSDEWAGKTSVSHRQARALALVKNLPLAFDELEGLSDFLDVVVEDYEKLLTSVEGRSREQQTDVLRAVFGEASAESEERASAFMAALAGGTDEDD